MIVFMKAMENVGLGHERRVSAGLKCPLLLPLVCQSVRVQQRKRDR